MGHGGRLAFQFGFGHNRTVNNERELKAGG